MHRIELSVLVDEKYNVLLIKKFVLMESKSLMEIRCTYEKLCNHLASNHDLLRAYNSHVCIRKGFFYYVLTYA